MQPMRQATAEVATPFGEPVEEIHLSSAPLIAVVAQIRFPQITSITHENFIGGFQEHIREDYPVLRKESGVDFVLTPDGVSTKNSTTIWKFCDHPQRTAWTVSLAPSFVSLDTSQYKNRTDFLERLRLVLNALGDTIKPTTCDRIGIRYVDRILLESDTDLADLIRKEILAIATVDPGGGANQMHSISDVNYSIEDATFHGRWGQIPPGVLLDPLHEPAVESPSWILDLDMYKDNVEDFDTQSLISTAGNFAERIYRFFRWSVRPEFFQKYGGTI